jgi:hypothetical protein
MTNVHTTKGSATRGCWAALTTAALATLVLAGSVASAQTLGGGIALRTVPVAPCNGQIQGNPFRYTGPLHVQVRVTAADAGQLAAYNGVMLAPRGWHCNLVGGSGGDTLKAYNPSAGIFPSNAGGYEPQEAVSAYFATTGNHALYQACAYFPLAVTELKKLGFDCTASNPTPTGETQTRVSADEMDFTDPPGVIEGTGDPSGGRYKAIGLELFDSFYDAAKGGAVENASTATCTLSPSHRHFCAAILRGIRAEFQRTLKETR